MTDVLERITEKSGGTASPADAERLRRAFSDALSKTCERRSKYGLDEGEEGRAQELSAEAAAALLGVMVKIANGIHAGAKDVLGAI